MNALICITNHMDDVPSCVHRDVHDANCDTWEWVWNPERQRQEATGKPCGGCLPREARHGMLCHACYERLTTALDGVWPWLSAMKGVDVAVKRDNAGVRAKSGPPIPIPPVQLAVDEVTRALRSYPGDPDQWIAYTEGAQAAVRFTRAALTAIRSHPAKETPHRVRRVRCQECEQLTLVWRPPGFFGDTVTVTCSNDECGAVIDQESFEKVAEIEEHARRRA